MRSKSYELLANSAPDAEVAAAITASLMPMLVAAKSAADDEARPASDVEISAAVAAIVSLIGQEWSPDGRDEFIVVATTEFMRWPGGRVLDALDRARRRITSGRMLVAWVCDDVEPAAAKLQVERDRLTRLIELGNLAA